MSILINILTRTYKRPTKFKICRKSIDSQTYKNINHIIGSECKCEYLNENEYIKLSEKKVGPKPSVGKQPAPWNLHLNEMGTYVKEGWVMYIDDDDMFIDENSLQTIIEHIENENQLILWRVNINGKIIPNDTNFGKIVAGNISSLGFMFHSKYLPVDWGSWTFGDYRAVNYLANDLKLEQKWINKQLTKTQKGFSYGKPE